MGIKIDCNYCFDNVISMLLFLFLFFYLFNKIYLCRMYRAYILAKMIFLKYVPCHVILADQQF